MMHLAVEQVGSLPEDAVPPLSTSYLHFAPFHMLSPTGVWGRPGDASAEKGTMALEVVVATTGYIERAFAQLAELKGTKIDSVDKEVAPISRF